MRLVVAFAFSFVVGLGLALGGDAWARAQADLPYGIDEAFSTAVRFVRIDRGCKLVDKDADAAFVAFECSDGGRVRRGSMEIIKLAAGVRTQVTLGDDTHGMELRWLELFERKLREEHGTPH
jgi:hypothetical protein